MRDEGGMTTSRPRFMRVFISSKIKKPRRKNRDYGETRSQQTTTMMITR
jgi:hypothetical protein